MLLSCARKPHKLTFVRVIGYLPTVKFTKHVISHFHYVSMTRLSYQAEEGNGGAETGKMAAEPATTFPDRVSTFVRLKPQDDL